MVTLLLLLQTTLFCTLQDTDQPQSNLHLHFLRIAIWITSYTLDVPSSYSSPPPQLLPSQQGFRAVAELHYLMGKTAELLNDFLTGIHIFSSLIK